MNGKQSQYGSLHFQVTSNVCGNRIKPDKYTSNIYNKLSYIRITITHHEQLQMKLMNKNNNKDRNEYKKININFLLFDRVISSLHPIDKFATATAAAATVRLVFFIGLVIIFLAYSQMVHRTV